MKLNSAFVTLRNRKLKLPIFLLFAIGVGSILNATVNEPPPPLRRKLNSADVRKWENFQAICTSVSGSPNCSGFVDLMPKIEASFSDEGARWQVVQQVSLSDHAPVRADFEAFPKECRKLEKLVAKEKKNDPQKEPVKKLLIKEVRKEFDSNPEFQDALIALLQSLTESEVRRLVDELFLIQEEPFLAMIDEARADLLSTAGK